MFKKLIMSILVMLTVLSVSSTHAKTWVFNGILWSDTCYHQPSGLTFTFYNQPAPVGSPCSFTNGHITLYGIMG